VTGTDPQLVDPEQGDFRLLPGSPALAYGCQSFLSAANPAMADPAPPPSVPRGPAAPDPLPRSRSLITVSGPITLDTTWDADTVSVVGDIFIPDGVALSIEPGAYVRFEGFYSIQVLGRITAVGTPSDRIVFSSAHPQLWQPDTTKAGSWHGITFPATLASNGISRLEWCDFSCSKAVGVRTEGGVFWLDAFSGLEVHNCRFTSNLAFHGGVLYAQRGSAPRFTGCLMTENNALLGGSAVYCADGYPRLTLCTMVLNHSLNPEPFDDTGVVHAYISKPWLTGCIVRDNSTSFFLGWELREAKPHYVRWTDIDAGGFPGEGDYDADPLFVGNGPHPLALTANSPCINAGPPDADALPRLPLDLAGLPRESGGRLDSGAYECTQPTVHTTGTPAAAAIAFTAAPNPFGTTTTFRFTLPGPTRARLTIHDAAGRRIALVLDRQLGGGLHEVIWRTDAADDPLGETSRRVAGCFYARLDMIGLPSVQTKLVRLR
jgi:hypothetical protein